MAVAYSKTANSIVVVLNYTPRVVPKTHPNFDKIADLITDPDSTEADILPLLKIVELEPINKFSLNVVIKDGQLFYKGYPVNNSLSKMILELVNEGKIEAAKPFEAFLENAYQNPDPRAVTDLFDWVINTRLPITPDGFILGWKAVREDYYSIHGNGHYGSVPVDTRFDHHIGNLVQQDRMECDANPDVTCSRGLHFAAPSYLPSYASGGSRIVALKINPRDVVAFPRDYGWAKGRASEYVVVGEVPAADVPTYYPQGRAIHRGWAAGAPTPGMVKPKVQRTAEGFAVGQVWTDGRGVRHTVIDTNSGADGYPIQTDLGRFTASGRFVDEDQTNVRDLKALVADVA